MTDRQRQTERETTTQNKLQLNNAKTEALLFDPQNSPNLPLSIVG